MSFNQYSVYSAVSVSEVQNEENLQKLIDLSLNLKKIRSVNDAKELVKSKFNVVDYLSNYSLGSDTCLNIDEDETSYSVNLVYGNENRTYTFKK